MKHLLSVALMFVTSFAFCQFNASASAGYGIALNNANSQYNYQAGFSVTPSYTHQKFEFGLRSTVFLSDSKEMPQVFTGLNISYPIYKIHYSGDENGQHKITLAGHWLYGSQGYQLIGGTVSYGIDCNWNFDVNMSQEYKTKSFYTSAGLSYYFIKN